MTHSLLRHGRSRTGAFIVLALAVLLISLASAVLGQFSILPADVIAAIGRAWGLADPNPNAAIADATLLNVRFPRIILGLFVGAALGVSGAVMQALFGNPLAEPGVIGISSGAAMGACAAIVTGANIAGLMTLPLAAFLGALLTTVLVYMLSLSGGRAGVLTMILTGIAVTAVANAAIAFMVFLADDASRDQIVFWQMGSLNGAVWRAVISAGPVITIALVVTFVLARNLDLLALGERAAQHAGVNVERLRIIAIICAALLTGAAVAYSGIIAFVGLIVPHVLRLWLGPSNRVLLPASALGGAFLVASSDLAARTLVPFADLPIGIFTALVGGPLFFVLIRYTLRTGVRA